jgi:hypothetical protein
MLYFVSYDTHSPIHPYIPLYTIYHTPYIQTLFQSMGDTSGHHYVEFKYVESDVVISGTDTLTGMYYTCTIMFVTVHRA